MQYSSRMQRLHELKDDDSSFFFKKLYVLCTTHLYHATANSALAADDHLSGADRVAGVCVGLSERCDKRKRVCTPNSTAEFVFVVLANLAAKCSKDNYGIILLFECPC